MTTGSVLVRKSLGRQLKKLRLEAGKTVPDVMVANLFSKTKLQGIESGDRPVKLADVWALCRLYGADEALTDRLSEMTKNISAGGWWEDYSDIMPSWFSTYVEFESASSRLFMYDPELVPGLLQERSYQRAVFETYPDPVEGFIERQLNMRADRQRAVFERTPPVTLTVVLSEGVLDRLVGGQEVMDRQKAHLLRLAQGKNVRVLVLPWTAGAHLANKGALNIVDFDSEDEPSVVYLETYVGGRYVDDENMVRSFRSMFETITAQSVPIEEHLQ